MPKLTYDKIEKRVMGNSPYEDLEEYARDYEISKFCPKCYENEKVKIPQGEKIIKYRHLWENMKKIQYGAYNRTSEVISQCTKCNYTLKEITIHRAFIKRKPINMIKSFIDICIDNTEKTLANEEYKKYCGEELFEFQKGYLHACKQIKKYIEGDEL